MKKSENSNPRQNHADSLFLSAVIFKTTLRIGAIYDRYARNGVRLRDRGDRVSPRCLAFQSGSPGSDLNGPDSEWPDPEWPKWPPNGPVEICTTLQLNEKGGKGTKMWFNVEGAYHRTADEIEE